MKLPNEYENAIMVFNNNLGSSNSEKIDQFFMRKRLPIQKLFIYQNLDLTYRKEVYEIIVANSFCLIKR